MTQTQPDVAGQLRESRWWEVSYLGVLTGRLVTCRMQNVRVHHAEGATWLVGTAEDERKRQLVKWAEVVLLQPVRGPFRARR